MASTSNLYEEKLMEILEDHSGFWQKPPADFTQETYNPLTEGLYLKLNAEDVQDDITKTLGDFGKTDRKGFLQTFLCRVRCLAYDLNPQHRQRPRYAPYPCRRY